MRARRTFRRTASRSAPRKVDWARGALSQTVAATSVFSINLLSGWETEAGYDFRGIVKGLMQSWFTVSGTTGIDGTLAIGILPTNTTVATGLLTGAIKSYPWMYYRRIQTSVIPSVDGSILFGACSFDTNTRSPRKLRQAGDQLTLLYDNLQGTSVQIRHWSNILLTS